MREDAGYRYCMEDSCRHDIRFWVNTFCYTLDTRTSNPVLPFVSYDYQDVLMMLAIYNATQSLSAENSYRRWDIGCDKSRDMGITWTVLYILDYIWRFWKWRDILCVSRTRDLVDGSPKSHFAKLDFLEERMPGAFMVRGMHHDYAHGRPNLEIHNEQNGTRIEGDSAHPDTGRQGRYLIAFRDEEPAAQYGSENTKALNQTTRFQFRVGTPNGTDNSLYAAKIKGGIDWISLHWSNHPEKSRGLYSVENGKVTVIDEEWHREHPGYEFMQTETHADPGAPWEFLRSPWFDGEDRAADSVFDIMQEFQISYLGTGAPFFRSDKLQVLKAMNVRPPTRSGTPEDFLPEHMQDKMKFVEDRDVRTEKVRVWYEKNARGLPPQDTTYSFGIDIAAGSGASDSVLSVVDDTTREKVFVYRTNGLTPEDFSKVCACFYEYFTTKKGVPFVVWDMGGHGIPFGRKFLQIAENADVYYWRATKDSAPSKVAGMPSSKKLKLQLMTEYRSAMFDRAFISFSESAYEQAGQFKHDGKGGVHHVNSTGNQDDSATGDQHGDEATSEAMCVRAMSVRPSPKAPEEAKPDYQCMMRRRTRREEARRAKEGTWY